MKAYQDKKSGKWKWGTRGEPIYESKAQCERAGMDIITEKLRILRDRLNNTVLNYGN